MPKTSVQPVNSDAVELLTKALADGHAITLSLATPPHVGRPLSRAMIGSLLFSLTRVENLIFAELMAHPRVSREEMYRAVSHTSKAVSKFGTVSVALCTLRKKLRPFEIDIITDYTQGFRLTTEGRAKLSRMIAEYDTEVAAAATNLNPV